MHKRFAIAASLLLCVTPLLAAPAQKDAEGRENLDRGQLARHGVTATMVTPDAVGRGVRNSVSILRRAPIDDGQVWIATRSIYVDGSTGRLRKPTALETRDLVRSLQQMLRTASADVTVQANGTRQIAASTNVIITRANEEGGVETLCVESFEQAASFLGLVQQTVSDR